MALIVIAVSKTVSPLEREDDATAIFMTLAPSPLPASSNELWVRVDASKKKFTCVRPASTGFRKPGLRFISTYAFDRSSNVEMSVGDKSLMLSRCWCLIIGAFDLGGAIKIGCLGGERQKRKRKLHPHLFAALSSFSLRERDVNPLHLP